MLFADLLSLYLVTFLMLFILVHVTFFSSRCMLELKFAIYYEQQVFPHRPSYALLVEESLITPGFLQTLPAHQQYISNSAILHNNYILFQRNTLSITKS